MCKHHDCHTEHLQTNERKTRIVTIISAAAMLLEIISGYLTNSMALLSDGWHMCTHVIAIGAGWAIYKYLLWRQQATGPVSNSSRILSLAGYTNALLLFLIAVVMFVESGQRLFSPETISYPEALTVTSVGLLVNVVSAKVLHYNPASGDINLRGTYLHIMSDILTSVLALVALIVGLFYKIPVLDSLMGIVGSVVIIVWAWGLAKDSGKQLIELNAA